MERVLGTLLKAGFSPRVAGHAFLALDSYIYGYERQRSYLLPGDGEEAAEPAQEVLEAVSREAFPSLVRVATEYASEPFDDDEAFDFGLGLILDGLQRHLEQDRPSSPDR